MRILYTPRENYSSFLSGSQINCLNGFLRVFFCEALNIPCHHVSLILLGLTSLTNKTNVSFFFKDILLCL